MRRISEFLFYVWLLSLPFYRYDLVGTLSFDQILGPSLVVLWLVVRPTSDQAYTVGQPRSIAIALILLLFYFLSHSITFVLSQSAIWRYTYRFLTDMPYFLLPVLYIRSALMRRRAEDCVVLIALVGALSSFLVALGVLNLTIARESADRLGIEGLELTRATGLFTSFGDMAILTAFSLLIVLSTKRETLVFLKRNAIVIIGIVGILFLGFAGSQSRNILITVIVTLFLDILLGRWSKGGTNWIPRFYFLVFLGSIATVIVVGFYFEPLFNFIASIGGKSASGTAHARLEQYEFGMKMLDGRLLSGAPPAIHERYEVAINSIHNMWIKELVIGGMLAVMAMAAFLLFGMTKAIKCLRIDPLDRAARIRVVLCVTLFVSTQFNPSGTSVFWLMLGLIYANSCVHGEARLAQPVPARPRPAQVRLAQSVVRKNVAR